MDTIRYILALIIWATFPPALLYWYLIHPFIGYWRRVGGPAPAFMVVAPVCLMTMGVLLRWNPVASTDLGQNWAIFGAGFSLYVVSWWMERKIRVHLDFRTLAGVPELRWGSTAIPSIPTTIDEFIAEPGAQDDAGADAAPGEDLESPVAHSSVTAAEADRRPLSADEPVLLQEGMYARVRHPRYTSVTIGVWSWCMMANHGAAYLIGILTVPALLGIIHFEEKELIARFGDRYREYQKRVPALIPRRTGD